MTVSEFLWHDVSIEGGPHEPGFVILARQLGPGWWYDVPRMWGVEDERGMMPLGGDGCPFEDVLFWAEIPPPPDVGRG